MSAIHPIRRVVTLDDGLVKAQSSLLLQAEEFRLIADCCKAEKK